MIPLAINYTHNFSTDSELLLKQVYMTDKD